MGEFEPRCFPSRPFPRRIPLPSLLIAPHGGALVDLRVDDARAAELKRHSREWSSLDLTPRQICDLEMLLNGGFSPLRGFLARADYESVRDRMRLTDGTLWPIPITLDVPEDLARTLAPGATLALGDAEGVMLAAMRGGEVGRPVRGLGAVRGVGGADRT